MRIESSTVGLQSQRVAVQQRTVTESLTVWRAGARPQTDGPAARDGSAPRRPSVMYRPSRGSASASSSKKCKCDQDENAKLDPRYLALKMMLERLFGIDIDVFEMEDLAADTEPFEIQDPNQVQARPSRAQIGVIYDYHETYAEIEHTQFQASGVVKTADGKEIAFSLKLDMQREFYSEESRSVRLGAAAQAKDPLVINFDGSAAQLTDTRFSFDLDSDGKAERMPGLAAGSGFLAFDKNADGKVNNGGELFGVATGDGFAELAAYDEDGNMWIDEADSIFSKLSVWNKTGDAEGQERQTSLKDAGVGAIYLGRVATDFALKDEANNTQGQIRSTSVVLMEDGGVGSVQQVDVVV